MKPIISTISIFNEIVTNNRGRYFAALVDDIHAYPCEFFYCSKGDGSLRSWTEDCDYFATFDWDDYYTAQEMDETKVRFIEIEKSPRHMTQAQLNRIYNLFK